MQKHSKLTGQRHNRLTFADPLGQFFGPSLQSTVSSTVERRVRRLDEQAAHLCIPFSGDGSMPLALSRISHPRSQAQASSDVTTVRESLRPVDPAYK